MSIAARLRKWSEPYGRRGEYSPIGVGFHWTMAGLIAFQLWWGWRTSGLPVGGAKLAAYELHAQLGLAVLVLALLRGLYRIVVPGPVNDADKPGWQSTAAHLTHFAFYGLFIALPLTGWAMLSATGPNVELSLLGLPWPHLPLDGLSAGLRVRIETWAETAHGIMIWAMCLLIVAHVAAALKHYWIDKDDVLPGMLPALDPIEEPRD